MQVQIRLFAGLAEAVGERAFQIEVVARDPSLADLRALLAQRFPQLAGSQYRFAIGDAYASDEEALPADSAVALIPPVSGG